MKKMLAIAVVLACVIALPASASACNGIQLTAADLALLQQAGLLQSNATLGLIGSQVGFGVNPLGTGLFVNNTAAGNVNINSVFGARGFRGRTVLGSGLGIRGRGLGAGRGIAAGRGFRVGRAVGGRVGFRGRR